ncbi:MAG: glycosyltransferase [Oscillospiraceae bacterium]
MKISLIVPIYNTEKYLERCISSLLAQSHTDLQIILVDDGSTDGCVNICQDFAKKDSRVEYFYKENGGLSSARNFGIEKASGEYIGFVDSDDCLSPFFAERLLNMCLKNDCPMSLCAYQLNDETTPVEDIPVPLMLYPTEVITKRDYFLRIYTRQEILYVSAWDKLYRKSLFDTLKFPEGMINEDEAIIHHLVDSCENIAVSYEPLYFYTQRQGSIMKPDSFKENLFDTFVAYEDRLSYFEGKNMPDLMFFTQKNYLVAALSLYNSIKEDVIDGKMYKTHLMRMYRDMLSRAGKNPASSRKFILKMKWYSLCPKAFKGVKREDFLFKA